MSRKHKRTLPATTRAMMIAEAIEVSSRNDASPVRSFSCLSDESTMLSGATPWTVLPAQLPAPDCGYR